MWSMNAFRVVVLAVMVMFLSGSEMVSGLEATWTPNEADDGGGPLPLSQAQRDQLSQLDATIAQSENPEAMLAKVAESNGMSAQELGSMLMRNRRDMEMGISGGSTGGPGANTLPRKVISLVWSVVLMAAKSARVHPQTFSITALTLILLFYVAISAPRTGIVMSTSPKPLLSSGHTTFLNPPTKYITKYMGSDRYARLPSSLPTKTVKSIGSLSRRLGDEVSDMMDDGVTFEKLDRKSSATLSVTARKRVSIESLLPSYGEKQNKGKTKSKEEDEVLGDDDALTDADVRDAIELAHESALTILESRRFSEFVENPKSLRFQAIAGSKKNEGATIVMKSLGDWNRYGIQPLRLAYQEETVEMNSVGFYTLKGGHFDGEIRFSVECMNHVENDETEEDSGDMSSHNGGLVVSVSLVIAKKGRKLSKKKAEKMVSLLAKSMVTSILMQSKQTLARQSQSKGYRGRAQGRAMEKRHLKFENEKKQEEMAEDRRRRWQRGNPDAGHYRPSGHRMRSPNNC